MIRLRSLLFWAWSSFLSTACSQSDTPQSAGERLIFDNRQSISECATDEQLLKLSGLDWDVLLKLTEVDSSFCVNYAAGAGNADMWSILGADLQSRANALGEEIFSSCSTPSASAGGADGFESAYLDALEQLSLQKPAQFERFLSIDLEIASHSAADCVAAAAFMQTLYGLPPDVLVGAVRSTDFYDSEFKLSPDGERRFDEIITAFAVAHPDPFE